MTESEQTERLAYLRGRWSVEDVQGFLNTPPDVDPDDRDAVAEWLFELSVSLSLSDAIFIVQRDRSEVREVGENPVEPQDPPPPADGVYVEIAYVPSIRLCPGKMPGVPWERSEAVKNGQLEQWEAYQRLFPQQVAG
ncbi:hypothetical protein [Nocardioides sp.]|jgi:hypothetical protein|uniref:hypothetical protein n=1 Tax=Nocardioides sp. TaxID=35761 RepID=UPI002F40B8A8